jgi:hypothetical protein
MSLENDINGMIKEMGKEEKIQKINELKEHKTVTIEELKKIRENQRLNLILGDDKTPRSGHSNIPDRPVFEEIKEEETIGSTDPDRVDPGVKGSYDKKIYKLPFDVSAIEDVYVGKPHTCMCGCAGTYWRSTMGWNNLAKDDYRKDDKPDDAKVARVYSKMKRNALTNGVEVIDDYIYSMVIGSTQYTIYLTKGVGESKKINEKNFETKEAFITYLRETLIPDLIASGNEAMAEDFEEAIEWMTVS